MKNLELKKNLLSSGFYQDLRRFERYNYILCQKYISGNISMHEFNSSIIDIGAMLDDSTLSAYNQMYNSRRQRIRRTRKILNYLLQQDCLFVTLTFNDKTLSSTNASTRRRYIKSYLDSLGVDYIANKDFGNKNGREHYHCVIQTNFLQHYNYSLGNIDFRLCNNNSLVLSKYLQKLTLHSLKDTTCGRALTSKGLTKKVFGK